MGRNIKLSPDNNQSAYEQKTRAFTKRDFTVLKRRTDELNGISAELSTLINQNADAILLRATKTEVTALSGRVTTAEGLIQVNADNIALKVSETDFNGNTIIGKINLTSTTAEISASKINLTGYVTVTNLATAGQTTINGSNITTGTLDANSVTVTNLNATNITAGTLNVARIPNLNADKITVGVLNADRIPNISADKITTGTLNANNVSVTNLNATNITAGTLNVARIPVLGADKINVTDLNAISASIGSWSLGSTSIYSSDAGMTLFGNIRFWSGATFANRANANFRVFDTGNVTLGGQLTASQINSTFTYGSTVSSGRQVLVASGGTFGTSVSSIRYKEDVEDYQYDISALLQLPVVRFRYKQKENNLDLSVEPRAREWQYGTIAEEAERLGLHSFIDYDDQGRPDYFFYDRLPIALLQIAKQQNMRIEQLEKEVLRA